MLVKIAYLTEERKKWGVSLTMQMKKYEYKRRHSIEENPAVPANRDRKQKRTGTSDKRKGESNAIGLSKIRSLSDETEFFTENLTYLHSEVQTRWEIQKRKDEVITMEIVKKQQRTRIRLISKTYELMKGSTKSTSGVGREK